MRAIRYSVLNRVKKGGKMESTKKEHLSESEIRKDDTQSDRKAKKEKLRDKYDKILPDFPVRSHRRHVKRQQKRKR